MYSLCLVLDKDYFLLLLKLTDATAPRTRRALVMAIPNAPQTVGVTEPLAPVYVLLGGLVPHVLLQHVQGHLNAPELEYAAIL